MTLSRVHCALVFALFSSAAFAQDFRATLTGHITDPTGTGVPNAKVTVKNLATNEAQSQTTSGEGDYTVPFLIPGTYSVTAEAAGFRAAVRQPVELHTQD